MQLKNKNPLVSVIVPAYNEEKYIEKCLRSINEQTYKNIELIFIDDGSKDSTKTFAKKYVDITISQKHQGPGVARNKGAEKAKGDILIFIDADMYLDKNYVKNIIQPIIKGNTIATFTKEEYVANENNIWARCYCIDNNLPFNRRVRKDSPGTDIRIRAMIRDKFIKTGGYLTNSGHGEDKILKSPISLAVSTAICYHYNPDTLNDVFFSARWEGRGMTFSLNVTNVLRYSLISSLMISLRKVIKGAPFQLVIYKIVFDFGILCGILSKNPKTNFSK